MVVAVEPKSNRIYYSLVEQPLAECTAIFTMCIVEHGSPFLVQWQYTKPAHINGGTNTKTVPASKIKGQCNFNTPN